MVVADSISQHVLRALAHPVVVGLKARSLVAVFVHIPTTCLQISPIEYIVKNVLV